ncbi:hypothetical protein CLAFUW4_07292 [Fulvia fulva]|uniref:Cupin type-1 domain-containing protein n=1 Tax=Passalora fulva TaxID=5499 RepID=A0A9Q8PA56_PASFU|nr:uncharacterized protein CLAFUR5_07422 [Fulvia fulva]KAK4622055.1 hypothetical protein CLAFUR4_07300 [Fulvia fulva]KAK4622766.1 hypothetical protein CLAFUR0_07298 [Fulvia fulva]UJO18691.1 hypothetical protein CLAFUR5_07422 [Fulvia fulva]WPV16547.1 hypothetical protein CLAFUW4_07292 [Fulvia fulva]WPV31242.1 hypothetical protein CLAFUW7_07294 [Fulvia fulva]
MPEVQVNPYHLKPTSLIPNSPYPLLHYKGLMSSHIPSNSGKLSSIHNLYTSNSWVTHWIFRYGPTQLSHYHSHAHECMTVLSGTATIRFGVADTSEDMDENTYKGQWEEGGIEVTAHAGDVFIIPVGVAHKTYNPSPTSPEVKLLTPGTGKGVEAADPAKALDAIELEGFTMMGCYPEGQTWDFAVGMEPREFKEVWSVPKPRRDPVLGDGEEGLVGLWRERERAKL